MEKVYIALIIAAVIVIVVVVFLLRGRITDIDAHGSLRKQEGRLKVKAATPESKADSSGKTFSVDISGNKVLGAGRFSIFRNRVRITRNWFVGKPTVEVKNDQAQKRNDVSQS